MTCADVLLLTQVWSLPLVDILRGVLKESEEVYDEEPSINANDCFLKRDELERILLDRKSALEKLKTETCAGAPGGSKTDLDQKAEGSAESPSGDMEQPESSVPSTSNTADAGAEKDDAKYFQVQESRSSALASSDVETEKDDEITTDDDPDALQTLETEVDHLGVLMQYFDTSFAPM